MHDFQNCRIWAWNLAVGKNSRSFTYKKSLYNPCCRDLSYFALRAAVSEIQADFQNCHIWAWNLAIGKSSRSCKYTLFLPHGVEIELNFALPTAVSEIGLQASFKLPYLGMKSEIWRKVPNLHMYTLSNLRGRNRAYFCSTGSHFRDRAILSLNLSN